MNVMGRRQLGASIMAGSAPMLLAAWAEHPGRGVCAWSGCSADDLQGDFNLRNGFSLGDAVYVAQVSSLSLYKDTAPSPTPLHPLRVADVGRSGAADRLHGRRLYPIQRCRRA